MSETAYVIYEDTIFLRKIDHGFEIAEDYTGVVRTDKPLPEIEDIKEYLKRAGKPFKGKRDRFVLVNLGQDYEALVAWGFILGNANLRERSQETVDFVLKQPNVEAVIFVNDQTKEIEYATSEAQPSV